MTGFHLVSWMYLVVSAVNFVMVPVCFVPGWASPAD
jgi:hypothetical protein